MPGYKGKGGIYGDFIECVKTREKPFRDIELAVNTVAVSHLGIVAYTWQRSLKWDAAASNSPATTRPTASSTGPAANRGNCRCPKYRHLPHRTRSDQHVGPSLSSPDDLRLGPDYAAVKPIHEAIVATHGDAAARTELESRLAAVLPANVSRAAKDFACRVLRTIGSAESVAVLAGRLSDPEHSHMARFALERMPAPEAGAALREALAAVELVRRRSVSSPRSVPAERRKVLRRWLPCWAIATRTWPERRPTHSAPFAVPRPPGH